MAVVAGLDFGGSAVKACVADVDSDAVLSVAQRATETRYPAPGRAEFEPDAWWRAAAAAMREAAAGSGRSAADFAAVTVSSLRQGYVLLDEDAEIGPGVVNSDRRGGSQLERVRETVGRDRLYDVTGHWSAPQLTLPKLLAEQGASPDRWARARTVLFVHDWALWRLSGARISEPTMASAGQMLDIRTRTWASDLLAALGIGMALLPPLRDAGSTIGELRDGSLGLPLGLPVIVGGADTQIAASGAGGLGRGVVSVVAGTTTPVQVSSDAVPSDPLRHPWVSAHLTPGRWAVETNAGYTGMSFDWLAAMTGQGVAELAMEAASSVPGAAGISAVVAARSWNEDAWSNRAPNALIGFEPRHRRADVARAFLEAHAYGIRGNLEDLERAMGQRVERVCLLGGAAQSRDFTQLVADVTGRAIGQVTMGYPAGRAFAWLAARATDADAAPPTFQGTTVEPQSGEHYEEGYLRYVEAGDAVSAQLAGWAT